MGWIRVEGKPREVQGYQDGKTIAVLDLQVATAEDLPELGGEVENYIVAAGSTAQIVEADEITFVTLSGDSEEWWPDQSGTDSSKSLNMSAPKSSAQLGEGKSVLVQDEPEINLDGGGFEREIEQPIKEQKKEFVESIEEPEKDGEDDDELL